MLIRVAQNSKTGNWHVVGVDVNDDLVIKVDYGQLTSFNNDHNFSNLVLLENQ